MVTDHIWKNAFSPIFDPFLVPKRPLFKAFWPFPWAKTCHHGLKMGKNSLFEHPKLSTITFGKRIFDPFLVLKLPIFKAFWDFP